MLSVFAHAEYILGDQWIAGLGIRWSEVDRDFDHIPSRIRLDGTLSPLRTQIIGNETSKELLWNAGLS